MTRNEPDPARATPTKLDPAVHKPRTADPSTTTSAPDPVDTKVDTKLSAADVLGKERALKQTPIVRRPPGEAAPTSPAGPRPLPPPQPPPDGARVWYNRSADPDSPYWDMQGPDIAYADGVWYARHDDGTWQPFHEGPILDPGATTVVTEAMQYEAVAGTSMFPLRPSFFDLRIDGETGQFVTTSGNRFDPHDLERLRAADGTRLWFDTNTGTWWTDDDLDVAVEPVPPGPYVTLARGDGTPPPLDELGLGESLVFDPELMRYSEADTGSIVGFHQSQLDELRRWENRSGDDDAGYYDMQGPDIVYLDGIWYGVEAGRYLPFHEGPVLDLAFLDAPFALDYLHYELLAGTPLFGQGRLGDLGLRLDGERGVLIDADGEPIDPFTYDPFAPDTDDPADEGTVGSDGLDEDLVGDVTVLGVDDTDAEPDGADDDGPGEGGSGDDGDDAFALAHKTPDELIGLDDAAGDLAELPPLDEPPLLDGDAGDSLDADLAPPEVDDDAGFDDVG